MPVLARKDVPKESTWNREAVYPSWDDWQDEFDVAIGEIENLHAYQGHLGESPDRLLAWFAEYGRHFQSLTRTISELTDTDLKFEDAVDQEGIKHPVLQTTIAPTGVQSKDPAHRKSAWENYADGYLSMEALSKTRQREDFLVE